MSSISRSFPGTEATSASNFLLCIGLEGRRLPDEDEDEGFSALILHLRRESGRTGRERCEECPSYEQG